MMAEENELFETIIPPPVQQEVPVPEETDDQRTLVSLRLNPQEAERIRLLRRPAIAHLPDATAVDETTGEVVPLFDVGSRIVVDRCTKLLRGVPWLDTNVYIVVSINSANGLVTAREEVFANVHHLSFKDPHQIFKLAPKSGNPFTAAAVAVAKREAAGVVKKVGRGRPKGSKNRPKDVIKAEKAAYKAERAQKIAARKARKRA
jgi:hypothetical protein